MKRVDAKRSRRRVRSQQGFTLIEAIVATVVVSIVIATAITGLTTMSNASTHANGNARIDALLSGYGEALKSTHYVKCAEPSDYQSAMDRIETLSMVGTADEPTGIKINERLTPITAGGEFKIDVLSVENKPGCTADAFGVVPLDSGTQTISYRVTRTVGTDVQTRSAVIEKLNPDGGPILPHAIIDTPVLQTTPGNAVARYSFTATGSFVDEGELKWFDWNCDGRDETPINVMKEFGTKSPGPPSLAEDRRGRRVDKKTFPGVECEFLASSTETTHTMSLFVTDDRGQVSEEAVVTMTVAATPVARIPPVAQATPTPASGTVPLTVNFSSAGSRSPDGDISSYSWNFQDPGSGSSNTSTAPNPSHVFYQPGVYNVTLTVTDDAGVQASDIAQVTVGAVTVPLPVPRFTAPTPLVAPTRATFDASASTTGNGQPVAVYSWTFGDGGTASGAVVNHDFLNAGTFQVTLRVEDSAGRYATVTQDVVVLPFVAPTDFRLVRSRSYVPCLFFGCPGARTGYFDFGWTNQPKSPGDTVSNEINVTVLQGCVAWADQTRTYSTNAAGTWQEVRWEEPTTSPFDLSTQICAGSVYNYKMRVKRVNSLGTLYSPWSPTQRVTA